MTSLEGLIDERKQKREELQAKGINPYPAKSERTTTTKQFLDTFAQHSDDDTFTVAGRVHARRDFGKLTFLVIEDESGRLQLFIQAKELDENDQIALEQIERGDIVQATGTPTVTKTGEQSLRCTRLTMLTKAIRPLPEEWFGMKEHEERYRRRYVDLIMNEDVRSLFRKRSAYIHELRTFWQNRGFMEVETPILEHVPGGAEAEPFITHHNTLDIDLYLRISLELHQKRLLVGGYEKIFELGKVFRNEGMSRQHLQEFTSFELYWAYADYEELMENVEECITSIIKTIFGSTTTEFEGTTLEWKAPWPRIRYGEIFKEKTGIDIAGASRDELFAYAKQEKIGVDDSMQKGRLIDTIYKTKVRPFILQPTFLIDHPVEISPLAKQHDDDKTIVERFQTVVMGAEVTNGWSELNDPVEQRRRFEEQLELRKKGDKEAYMMDVDFIESLEYGMPPAAGLGIGVDRLFMILADQPSIRDVVFFPIMKPKE